MTQTQLMPASDLAQLRIAYPVFTLLFIVVLFGFAGFSALAKLLIILGLILILIAHSLTKSERAKQHYIQITYVVFLGGFAHFFVGLILTWTSLTLDMLGIVFAPFGIEFNAWRLDWWLGYVLCIWQIYKLVRAWMVLRQNRALGPFGLI